MAGLSQKERMLLNDQKSHEEMCIQKYTKYANEATDPQLKQLFNTHASHERQHLNTINQIMSGQVPNMSTQGQQQSERQSGQQMGQQTGTMPGRTNQADLDLCHDMLMTEKYVSGSYDTVIFECADTNTRQALNHIQKEEQQHGEDLFNYMQSHGGYQVQ
ncbi:MAG: DUF892 family protein [Desulfitobacterium hafniense]|nr:DUF892 family protein [Desulfitobacterium hafniense]